MQDKKLMDREIMINSDRLICIPKFKRFTPYEKSKISVAEYLKVPNYKDIKHIEN